MSTTTENDENGETYFIPRRTSILEFIWIELTRYSIFTTNVPNRTL